MPPNVTAALQSEGPATMLSSCKLQNTVWVYQCNYTNSVINETQLKMKQSSLCTLHHLHQDKKYLATCSFKQKKKINYVTDIVKIHLSEHFSFAEIVHPTSQVWHIKMLIRWHEYCTGVPLAGHNKRPLGNVQKTKKT